VTDIYGSYSEGQRYNAFHTHLDGIERVNDVGVKFDPEVMAGLARMTYRGSTEMDWNDQGTLVEDLRCLESTPKIGDLVWLYFLAHRLEHIAHDSCLES
jgi:hypothetical protein